MVARVLVTTAQEKTWPTDKKKPVLFLGQWCKLYDRTEIWKDFESKTVDYHWDDRQKLYNDYRLLLDIHEKLIFQLSEILNNLHDTKHSIRYWRIIIGPWLGLFVPIVFDRWSMLNKTLKEELIDHCKIIKQDPYDSISNDLEDFCKKMVKADWNEMIYGQLLQLCWKKKISLELIDNYKSDKKKLINVTEKNSIHERHLSSLKKIFREKIKKLIPIFNRLFTKEDGYFFISTYLPLLIDFKLQVRLGQFPKFWKVPNTPRASMDKNFRKWKLEAHTNISSFESVIASLLPQHLPKLYLEGYDNLKSVSSNLPWPSKPKAIFTGTLWHVSEVFKNWAAEKAEDGVPLVIGQHGGHFGTSPFSFLEEHQIKIADKWISWGWKDFTNSNVTPIGNLKGFGTSQGYDPKGSALMVELTIPQYSNYLFATPVAGQFLEYFEEQKIFLNSLSKILRQNVIIRSNRIDFDWGLASRFKDEVPEVTVDLGIQDIRKLIKKSRLYISTYNATTFLESLAWNVPTIIFWNEKHFELSDDAQPYFQLLKSVGIFHNSPQAAAKHMTYIWDNVDDWWLSDSVQNARMVFCNQFSRNPKNYLMELELFFKNL